MKIKGNESLYFFKNYEALRNKYFIKIIAISLLAIPIMLLFSQINLLPSFETLYLFSTMGILALSILFSFLILKHDPFASYIKYLLVLTIGILEFLLSINQNTEVFMTFILLPIISCLYINKEFTRNISIVCYFSLILSIGIRAVTKDFFYEANYTRLEWFIRYAIGMTIEYGIGIISIAFLCRNNHYLIENDYEQTVEQIRGQTIIISSFMELLNKHSNVNIMHPKRCSQYVNVICRNLRKKSHYSSLIKEEDIPYITTATLVHDIGLIVIPQQILTKTEALSELEVQKFKLHTIQGEALFRQNMSHMGQKYLTLFCDIILYHHEQWNGQGYPFQLAENTIPLTARIVFAANLIDNLTNDHPSRKALSFDVAIDTIRRMAGREVDPIIAQVVYESREELRVLYEKMNQNVL